MPTSKPKPGARPKPPTEHRNSTRKVTAPRKATVPKAEPYNAVLRRMAHLIEGARHASARAVNVLMTATYWEIGRRIVEHEQGGNHRAGYGEELIERLSTDLGERFGRGFGKRNLFLMRSFYQAYPEIVQTVSAQLDRGHGKHRSGKGASAKTQAPPAELKTGRSRSKVQTVSALSSGKVQERVGIANDIAALHALSERFPLPWSHYVRLLTVEDAKARAFYETEALRNGWSVRQLDRQVSTRFYERTGASRRKDRMLRNAGKEEAPDPSSLIREPYLLEFLDLKDEYSESDLEEALVRHLEHFLLELGSDFTFVGRQRRLRVGKEWYRIDLLFFHRKLRCLVVIDLKVGRFTHADAGQMNLYLNYAREHWAHDGENPPVGLILCTEHDDAVAHYTLNNIGNNMMAREYRLALPKEKKLEEAIEKARKRIERTMR
ncbi:MAG: PDDEXK nuclease domain-containing protein [Flavobacteriales bacterium]